MDPAWFPGLDVNGWTPLALFGMGVVGVAIHAVVDSRRRLSGQCLRPRHPADPAKNGKKGDRA
jgi:hypothetical protein